MKQLIKYKNRKIYDKDLQRYVNLTEVADLITNGAKVVVKSHTSGKNVTNEVLSMIIAKAVSVNDFNRAAKFLDVARNV